MAIDRDSKQSEAGRISIEEWMRLTARPIPLKNWAEQRRRNLMMRSDIVAQPKVLRLLNLGSISMVCSLAIVGGLALLNYL